jgi:hypothetical protein
MEKDFDGFIKYLEKTKNPICGQAALLILLKLLPPQARGQLLDYTQSQFKTKLPDRSVSYAAINFYDPTQAPRPAQRQIAPAGSEITGVTEFPAPEKSTAAPALEATPVAAPSPTAAPPQEPVAEKPSKGRGKRR